MNLGASVFSLLCATTHFQRSTLGHHPKISVLQTAAKVPELKVFLDKVPPDILMMNSDSQRHDPLQNRVLGGVFPFFDGLLHCFVFSFPPSSPWLALHAHPMSWQHYIRDMLWKHFIYYCWSKYPFTTYPKESHISSLSHRREKQDIESSMLSSLRPPC